MCRARPGGKGEAGGGGGYSGVVAKWGSRNGVAKVRIAPAATLAQWPPGATPKLLKVPPSLSGPNFERNSESTCRPPYEEA